VRRSWQDLLSSGELFVVAAVLAAGAIGEILYAVIPGTDRIWSVIAGASCLLTLVGNTVAYVSIDSQHLENAVAMSWIFFIPTVIACASGIYVSAGK
jgi:hypothetical protein